MVDVAGKIKRHPSILNDNQNYQEDLVDASKSFIRTYCRLPAFPDLARGYSRSGLSPSTDISSIGSNSLLIGANGHAAVEVSVTLASCTTGTATATELQAQIRAASPKSFDEISVDYNSDTSGSEYYKVTSGRYGEGSFVRVGFNEDANDVCENLKLSPSYGGVEVLGSWDDEELQWAAAQLVEERYRQLKLGNIPGNTGFTDRDLSPSLRSLLQNRRRLSTRRFPSSIPEMV